MERTETFTVGAARSFTVATGHAYPTARLGLSSNSLPTGLAFADNGDGTATISGMPAAGTGGSYALDLYALNGIGSYAVQALTVIVGEAPSFKSSSSSVAYIAGDAASFTVATGHGYPSAALSLSGSPLPSGLAFADNGDGTAAISGTPAAGTGGSYAIKVTAANATGTVTQDLALTVHEASSFSSPATAVFTAGTAGSFTVSTGHAYPPPALSLSGRALPAGLVFTENGDGTAAISGMPAAGTGGSYALKLTAHNGIGAGAVQALTLVVAEAPSLDSSSSAAFAAGAAGSFTVATGHAYPSAALSLSGAALPSGLGFADNGDGTATISGMPAAGTGGSYAIKVTAANATGTVTQDLALTVHEASSFSSPATAVFTAGTAASFTVATGHAYPPAALSLSSGSLPTGLVFGDNGDGTATISGTPAVGSGGSYALTVTAGNGIEPDAVQALALTVEESPAATPAPTPAVTPSQAALVTVGVTHVVAGRRQGGKCVATSRVNRRKPSCRRTAALATIAVDGNDARNHATLGTLLAPRRTVRPGRYTLRRRTAVVAAFTFRRHARNRRVTLDSVRIHGRVLAAGRYVLTITATTTAGGRSKPRRLAFTLGR